MATQTVVFEKVKPKFLRLVDMNKAFYLNNPASDLKTWIFLTSDGGIECLDRESDDSLKAFEAAEREFDSPVWLVAIVDKNTDFSVAGMIQLLPDLAEACQTREYYFTSCT
jgi:hypothetical protein